MVDLTPISTPAVALTSSLDASERYYRAAQLADEAKSLLRRGDDRKAMVRVINAILELALTDEEAKGKRKVKLG